MKNNNLIAISGKINSGKDTIGKIIQGLLIGEEEFVNGIVGFLDSYKDYDSKEYPNDFQIKKFADKLKDIVCILIGCTREQLEDREFKEKELGEEWDKWKIYYMDYEGDSYTHYFAFENEANDYFNSVSDQSYSATIDKIKLTPRLLLQLLGTECRREILHPNIWVNALMSDYKKYKETKPFINSTLKDENYPNWIITDMRFPNEMKAVKDRGGITIRVNRRIYCPECKTTENSDVSCKTNEEGEEYIECSCGNTEWGNEFSFDTEHESEIALDNAKFDYILENNGTIEDLIRAVKQILIIEKVI